MNVLLSDYRQKVENELNIFFDEKLESSKQLDKNAYEMVKLLKEFTLRGGKRIRGALFYYGYKLFSDDNLDEVLKASMCFELIQSSLLIHDDIIDKDDLRRGGDTMHRSYEKFHGQSKLAGDAKHFGTSMGILAGDLSIFFANELLADLKLKSSSTALKELNRLIPWVIYGQLLDALTELQDKVEVDTVIKINRLKTATYTIEGPLRVGALLAGATKEQLESLSNYGVPLGKAFQIKDDILDLFGDESKVGKPIGSDIRQGKRNLLVTKALENASSEDKTFLLSCLGNKNLTDLDKVRAIVESTGALKFAQDLSAYFVKESKTVLSTFDNSKESVKLLSWLADYVQDRDL